MSRDKAAVARAKVAEADKLMKKSLLRWSTDPNAAAPLYEEAGLIYKTVDDHTNALKCFLLAADCNKQVDNLVLAGKNFEHAAKLLVRNRKYRESVRYWEQAHTVYYEDGKPDLATAALVKGAQAVAKTNGYVEEVVELYKRAISIMADNDKYHYGMEHFQRFNAYLIKRQRWQDVLENLRIQKRAFKFLKQTHNLWKANLCITVACCAMGDLVLADEYNEQFSREHADYSKQIEFTVSDRLIDICDERDLAAFEALKTDDTIRYIEPAFARVIKRMTSLEHIKGNRKPGHKVLFGSDDESQEGEVDSEEEEDSDGEGFL